MARERMTSFLSQLFGRRPSVTDRSELTAFIASESAFVSQKCTVEYCRARSGLLSETLFKESAFTNALDVCRWESYAAVLSDLVVIAMGKLSPHVADRSELAATLQPLATVALGWFGPPPHRSSGGWNVDAAAIGDRLAAAALSGPRPAHEVALASAGRVFDVLPMHPKVRFHDRELVTNNLRFGLARSAATMEERFDSVALCRSLLSVEARP